MFAGAQVSLYPMTDGFVEVILSSLSALDPYRERLRIETDDISTLIVGPPEVLFPALRDLYVAAASSRHHVVLRGTLSRGCRLDADGLERAVGLVGAGLERGAALLIVNSTLNSAAPASVNMG